MLKTDLRDTTARLYRLMAGLGVCGSVGVGVLYGLPAGVGFAVGAMFSIVNFWFWHRLVNALGRTAGEANKGSIVLFAGRYGLFAIALYVILQYFEASLFAALAGIFVAVAAVLVEICIELIYGT